MTIKLPLSVHQKPWGSLALPCPFKHFSGDRIGEIWFDPPAGEALLVKYLFTDERLSIQVHPDDEQARRWGQPSGKEECWYILDARPGAAVGIGTSRALDAAELQDACLSGEIEDLLEWHPVSPGMFFHIPPGTVHAIGAGISLVEIQQNSDATYRLYDYGRPRPLHLREAIDVARARPMPPMLRQIVDPSQSRTLLASSLLHVAHFSGNNGAMVKLSASTLVVPITGRVEFANLDVCSGESALVEEEFNARLNGDTRFLTASIGAIPGRRTGQLSRKSEMTTS